MCNQKINYRFWNYIFEGPGEILSVKEEYAQVRWRRPVPDTWLKLDQLKEYIQ